VHTLRKAITRCLLVGSLAVTAGLGLASPTPAAAYNDCQYTPNTPTNGSPYTCRYTQISNNNWPVGSADPSCGNSCFWWPRAPQSGGPISIPYSIQIGNSNRAKFFDDAAAALYAWSGQPYNSPWTYDCHNNNTCGNPSIVVRGGHYGRPGGSTLACGYSNVINYASDNGVFSTYSDYNIDEPFAQGPSAGSCDATTVIYHEVGHSFTEGHSSVDSDVMFWMGHSATIDGDAQSYLNAMYGPYKSSGHSGGGCPSCRSVCGIENCVLAGQDLEGYLNKAWSLSQGTVPPVPDPVSMITPESCPTTPYTIWINCTANWLRQYLQ
jgi:hypothetical protein